MSEYAVTGKDAGQGSLLASLAEAGFLIGIEKNRFLDTNFILCFAILYDKIYYNITLLNA